MKDAKRVSWMGEWWWEGREGMAHGSNHCSFLYHSVSFFICLSVRLFFSPTFILSLSHLLAVCLPHCLSFSPFHHTVWLVCFLYSILSAFFFFCGLACVGAWSGRFLIASACWLPPKCAFSWFLPVRKHVTGCSLEFQLKLCPVLFGWVGLGWK